MDNIKLLGVGAIVSAVVALAVNGLRAPTPITIQPSPVTVQSAPINVQPAPVVVQNGQTAQVQAAPVQAFGSLAGPDIPSQYLQWGGVYQYNVGVPISATSSMLCVISSPPATSTPTVLGIRFETNPIGAFSLDISTTTSTGYGSSTPAFIASAPVAATPSRPIIWVPGIATTTLKGVLGGPNLINVSDNGTFTGESLWMLPPNTNISFRVATATPNALSSYDTGKCVGSFLVI